MDTTKENYLPTFTKRGGVFISWRLLGFASVALFAIVVVGLFIHRMRGSDSERGTRLLIEAFSRQRLIEPRLSGGFNGGAFNPAEHGEAYINTVKVNQATELIEDAFAEHDPYSRLAYGRLLLSKGDKSADALKYIRPAVAQLPGSAEPHNDLGVCLMEQGRLEDALDEFNIALKSKADMAEALFNRGLCYERLSLRDAANEDYSRLLGIERDQSWINEIKQRQQEMSAPIMPAQQQKEIRQAFKVALDDGNIDEATRLIDQNLEVLLKRALYECPVEYLEAADANNQVLSDAVLNELKLIGGRFNEKCSDTSINELAEYLSNLPGSERRAEIELIQDFYKAELLSDHLQAQVNFKRLKEQFGARSNHFFQFLSILNYANRDYHLGRYISNIEKLRECLSLFKGRTWSYRMAQVASQFGLLYSRLGQDALAIKYFEQAVVNGRGVPLLKALTLQYVANTYWNLKDVNNGLDALRKSSKLFLTHAPQFKDLANNAMQISEFYHFINNDQLALLYAKQALHFAEEKDSHTLAAQAASCIALEYGWLNKFEDADKELDKARSHMEKADPRLYTETVVTMRAAEIASLRNNLDEAIDLYSKSLTLIKQCEDKIVPMMKVLRGRAEVYIQKKDYEKARQDLGRASQLIESYSADIADRKNRNEFLDASQSVFDEMLLLNGPVFANWREAFNISEQSRARTLLDDLLTEQGTARRSDNAAIAQKAVGNSSENQLVNPLTLAEVQAELPSDLRLVTYSVTGQRTFIFVITRTEFDYAESGATTETLDQLVRKYLSDMKSMTPVEALSVKAGELYDYLIKPIEGRLGDGKRLCIVPDKALHFLPFAALVDGSKKYLVESYNITYAPSASVLVECLAESKAKKTSNTEKLLAVGNPLFNKEMFPSLVDLPDAEREMEQIVKLYDNSIPLKGKDATKRAVLQAFKDCDVANLSLHCLVEERSPSLAALVLAEDGSEADVQSPGGEGLLHLNEIYRMSLPRMRLVILSACESGLGQYYRGEGMVSLVRPFLALRVPTVVASLWSVDSQATAELVIDFHRERKVNSTGAGDAMRAAQIRMAHSASYQHPYYWAPFIVVGSNN